MLQNAYKYMEQAKDQDVVLCAGYTGSGKSTLFSYLMFGPEGLQEETITHYVGINKDKAKKRKVIANGINNRFKIGHSDAESETFLPSFLRDEKSNVLFCDVAGFGDTGSLLIQMIKIFTLHYLINNVKSIRVLVLFTNNQIRDQRGVLVSKLVHEAINLIENDLEMIHQYSSVFLPLVSTKRILKS